MANPIPSDLRAPEGPVPAWSRRIQARQTAIQRAYLSHAEVLDRGDPAERELARDIRRFVAEMPVSLTRRQAMAVELRQVLERQAGRGAPSQVERDDGQEADRRRLSSSGPATPQPDEVPRRQR